MNRDENLKTESKKKRLVLRKESIRALDSAQLSRAVGGIPPDTSTPFGAPLPTQL